MAELERQLREVLEQELDIYRSILKLAGRKTEILKQNDVDALEALVLEERQVVMQVDVLEEKREKIIRGLAMEVGASEKLDLSSMAKYFSQEGQVAFKAIKGELGEVIEKLKSVNSLNERLIKDSLDYIDFSLNLMTSASVEGNYGQDLGQGQSRGNASKRNLFDGKA